MFLHNFIFFVTLGFAFFGMYSLFTNQEVTKLKESKFKETKSKEFVVSPVDILKERFAKGEIEEEEYKKKLLLLTDKGGDNVE